MQNVLEFFDFLYQNKSKIINACYPLFPKNKIFKKIISLSWTFLLFFFVPVRLLHKNKKNKIVIVSYSGKIVRYKNEFGDYSNFFLRKLLFKAITKKIDELVIFNLSSFLSLQKFLFFLKFKKVNRLNLTDLKKILKFLKQKKQKRFIFNFFFFSTAMFYYKILKTIKPKIIIINSMKGFSERLFAYVAKFLKITTIFVPHGLGELRQLNTIKCTDICVIPPYSPKTKFEDDIWRLGFITFAHWLTLKRNHVFDASSNNVVYASQPLVKDNLIKKETLQKFLDFLIALAQNYNFKIILKPHPRENVKFYKKIFSKKNFKIAKKEEPFYYFLQHTKARFLITHFSGSGIEALLSGLPVVSINFLKLKSVSKIHFFYKQLKIPMFTFPKDRKKICEFFRYANWKKYANQKVDYIQNFVSPAGVCTFLTFLKRVLAEKRPKVK